MVQISPYELVEGGRIDFYPCDGEIFEDDKIIEENLHSGAYGITELLIIKALYKYQYLNKANLVKAINLKLKAKLRKPKYDSNINLLVENGTIGRIYYHKTDCEEKGTVLYYLSYGAFRFMKEKYNKMAVTYQPLKRPEDILNAEIADILERASINQWHINLLHTYPSNIAEEGYYSKRRVGWKSHWFQSYFRIKIGNRKYLRVISISRGKGEESKKELLHNLMRIDRILAGTDEKNAIVIILCESMKEIENMVKDFSKYSVFKDIMPLFCLDMNTAEISGLRGLYTCKYDGSVAVLENYNIDVPVI